MSPVLSDEGASTCPSPSVIKQRYVSHNCPNNQTYHVVRTLQSGKSYIYTERCFTIQWVPPGHATVIDKKSGHLNTEPCREGTFQRHPYKSNTQCACSETKGHCNKTGQVVSSDGSTTEDRTCRCDFRRGYKFSTKPSNECVCLSSSEDCACIKEDCKMGYRMSPDSQCILEECWYSTTKYCKDYIARYHVERNTTESVPVIDTINCSEINTTVSDSAIDTPVSEINTTESAPVNGTSVSEKNTTVSGINLYVPEILSRWIGENYVTVIIVICVVLLILVLVVLLAKHYGIYDRMRRFCCQNIPFRTMLVRDTTQVTLNQCRQVYLCESEDEDAINQHLV